MAVASINELQQSYETETETEHEYDLPLVMLLDRGVGPHYDTQYHNVLQTTVLKFGKAGN